MTVFADNLYESSEIVWNPWKIHSHLQGIVYQNSRCCIRTSNGNTTMFDIMTGVRQGCVLSPFLFLIIVDFVMWKTMTSKAYDIKSKHDRLTVLDFVDDIALLSDSHDSLQDMTTKLHDQATRLSLCISCEKTKAMSVALEQSPSVTVVLHIREYMWTAFHILEFTSLEQVMQSSIRQQGWARQHPSFSDSAKYGTAMPSLSYICTNQLWFRQQFTQLIHGRKQQEFHIC